MIKIVVSIINFNGTKSTEKCLYSLLSCKRKEFELYVRVIDNHSETPFAVDYSKYASLHLTIDHSNKNVGFSGGHNRGIKYAEEIGARYVLVLNNDTVVDSDLIVNLYHEIESRPKAIAAVPKIYFSPGHEFHSDQYSVKERGKVIWYAGGKMDWGNLIGSHIGVDEVDSGQYDKVSTTEFATGACVMMPVAQVVKVGMFDERYFLYYEDNDLCMRLKKLGNIYFIPSAILWHDNAGSTGGSGSKLQDYYIARNRLLFGMKYAPFRTRVALIREAMRVLRKGREWQKKGVLDFFMNKFGRGSYPVSK